LLIETIDQFVLFGAGIGSQLLRRFNKNLVGVCSKDIQGFGDKLVVDAILPGGVLSGSKSTLIH